MLKLSFLHMMVTGVELYGVIDMIKFCISFYNKASISWGYKQQAVMTGCLVNAINAMLIAMASGTRIRKKPQLPSLEHQPVIMSVCSSVKHTPV